MPGISRRDFGTIVLATGPLAVVVRPVALWATPPLTLGVTTSSFRGLPRVPGTSNVDDVLHALKTVGATHVELALAHIEPAPPSVAPFTGGSPAYPRLIVLSPEQVASTNARARSDLRTWRLGAGLDVFERVRTQFASAGVTVVACSVSYNDSFTDEEIDVTFRQVKALGSTTVSSPLTMAMARRLVPFAERHQLTVAIHNQESGHAAGMIAALELEAALGLSSRFSLKLDVGNLTASGGDAVAVLSAHRARVSHVVLKDRLRSGGVAQPFGEGDTPIRAVLSLLKTSAASIPALVEYDYVGLRPVVDEVGVSLDYVRQVAK
jgi:sugar phosphate isomerase/epimerase